MYTKKIVVIILLILSFSYNKSVFAGLPKPTSQHGIGKVSYTLTDKSKKEILKGNKQFSFDGNWKLDGYGYLFTVSEENFQLYDYTKVSMLKIAEGQITNNQIDIPGFGSLKLYRSGDSLAVLFPTGKNIFATRMDSAANPVITEYTADPVANFEVFWNTFEENCILFQLTSTDWKALYNKYRPMVNSSTTDAELFDIFRAMLAPLKDTHTNLVDPFNLKEYSPGPKEHRWWSIKKDKIIDVISTYLDGKEINSAGNGHIIQGKINKKFGYLNFDRFTEYLEGAPYSDDAAFYTAVLDSLILKYRDAEAIIIDIRCNGGGYDQYALELASRFNTELRISHYKQVRTGGYFDFSEPVPVTFGSNNINYTGKPVILLTSGFTVSAADVCAMAFRQLPNVTIIGENTRGMFSDMLGKTLPNGWSFSLSNEKYTFPDGTFPEHIGITPDIYVKGDSSAFNTGRDLILEKAIETLNSLTKVENEQSKKLTYKLEQNYPNPFNPVTTINYQLPVSGHVVIKIYNILGNEVATLLNEDKEAGYYQTVFDGKGFSSGVYFYRLESGSFSQIRKFILMK